MYICIPMSVCTYVHVIQISIEQYTGYVIKPNKY